VEKLYLDVISQSQNTDEFWYTCVPDAYATPLDSCPGGSFREVEVMIDGTPAGVAPVYPWIYSGGISPNLWIPSPGVQTLNFTPYRVDLTPFAGKLDDGAPHTVGVQVYDAEDHFTVSGTLMAWQDTGAAKVTGSVTTNTLTAPVVTVDASKLVIKGANAHGPLSVTSNRNYTIAGTVNTSHGPVSTSVTQAMSFSNKQTFDITALKYVPDITQLTTVAGTTTTTDSTGTATTTVNYQYPLTVDLSETVKGVNATVVSTISQALSQSVKNVSAAGKTTTSSLQDTVTPTDTIIYNLSTGGGSLVSQSSAQHYVMKATKLGCYDRTITNTSNAVSGVTDGCKR
jgi:hypothetical protein